ncbi:cobalamin biosynthesis protein [Sulfodiicoccus acidiphilus]|uniref:cobalamin biosynthesis protein n=1 Tax=Sulfodiicoccus acidiphilus TaxID=1670455 RepID=UPI000F8388C0|nr:cobalamin biosynthesis protein [Sulfodiicoccus acidiphilus]
MVLVLALALVMDLVVGEPPLLLHPVVWTGKLAEKLSKPHSSRLHGFALWFMCVLPVLVPLSVISWLSFSVPFLGIIVGAVLLKISFSIGMLRSLVKDSFPLREDSRIYVSQLVRRDVWTIDLGHVASASIESLFESMVDGITSPLIWYLLLGLPGALLQRLANTMDSMVGYKTEELREEGYFSAKIDTLLNYVPARLTFGVMILAGLILGMNVKKAIRTLKLARMDSKNAVYPIAAAAGLLGVRLEKLGAYSIGEGELPTSEDIRRALRLFDLTLAIFAIMLVCLDYYLYGLSLFSYPYGLVKLL